MNKIKSIIAISLMTFLSACSLDTEMYNDLPADIFPENEAQQQAIKLSAYGEQKHLLDDWGWWLYMQEVTSDVLVFPQRGTDWEDGGKWRVLNRHTWNSQTLGVEGLWRHGFRGVVRTNQALDYFTADNEVAKKVRAELNVLRSYYYYLLLDNFGHIPYNESTSSSEGSPYRVKKDEVYERLVKVVSDALPLLPEASETENIWISKDMAHMLLGKLYLNGAIYKGTNTFTQADMDSVIVHMNAVIDNPNYALESDRLAPFHWSNENSSENIYTIANNENAEDGMRHNFRTLHTLHQQSYDLQSTPWNGCAIKPDFYQRLFAANDGYDDADDLSTENSETVDARAAAFLHGQQFDINGNPLFDDNGDFILTLDIKADIMNDGSDGGAVTRFSGYRVAKYAIEEGGGPIMNNDFPVFRLADALLMRAEAELRGGSGSTSNADDDLNKVRSAAGLGFEAATLESILDERGRELYMEGHRRQDLIRYGLFADRDWWSGADELDNGEHRLVFMVPYSQAQANPNLEADPISLNLE